MTGFRFSGFRLSGGRFAARLSVCRALTALLVLLGLVCVLFACGTAEPSSEPASSAPSEDSLESVDETASDPVSEETGVPIIDLSGLQSEDVSDDPSDFPSEDDSEESHVHVYEELVIPPDCTHDGSIRYRCACGDTYEEPGEPALGHSEKKTVVTEPTCEQEGLRKVECTRCGESRMERISALGHLYFDRSTNLYEEDGVYTLKDEASCSRCGKKGMIIRDLTVDCALSLNAIDRSADVKGQGGSVECDLKEDGSLSLEVKVKNYYTFLGWSDGSRAVTRTYTGDKPLTALFACTTYTMPVLNVHTENETMITHRDYYLQCEVTLSECDAAYALRDAPAKIRVRGNASSNYGDPEFPKKNKVHYRLKFETKTGMLGLNGGAKCKSWVLLRGDSNFLREPVSFKLFTDITEGKYFASDYTFVQLYVNGDYYGVYVLCEQTQIQKNRISIAEQKSGETALKTGYLIEIDNYAAYEPYHFGTNFGGMTLTDQYGVSKAIHNAGYSIKYDQMTNAQVKYVKKYVENVYQVVFRAIYKNEFYTLDADQNLIKDTASATAEECIGKVLDLEAAVAMYITREVAIERDGGCGSFFMYVDFTAENPKLTFAAPWDFSWAYANDRGFEMEHLWVSAFQPQEFTDYASDRSFTWFITLYKADFFRDMVKETWADMHKRKVQDGILSEIERVKTAYQKEFKLNNIRWNSGDQAKSADKLYSFLKKRFAYLDTEWALG